MKEKKKSKEKFCEFVNNAIDTKEHLTPARIRSLCRRHRRYILAYLTLGEDSTVDGGSGALSLGLIERVVKRYKREQKCHRNILDSETKFLDDVVDRMWKQSSTCHVQQ